MKGAQELKSDTAYKMKTIELTEEERQEREEARYEIWEANIRKHKRARETTEEMGWETKKLKGQVEKKKERKEQTTENQQERIYPERSTTGVLTGNRKEVKREKMDKPKANTLDQKRREEKEEIKGQI